ncbi:MAG: energy-coupling factor ABC transporter permease [Candidatus Contendobacter sp.]|nr:energy-coupling factor ABC transporter permease [Candidatus Contendobacter sp.]
MHIPQNLLDGSICPVTAVVSGLCLAGAALAAHRSAEKPQPLRFAAITAFIFAAQMMNFPISGGTSGHLLGGVLASALLGVPFGVLALALVVTIQALVFADGGLTVLGANVLNMAVLGAGLGGLLRLELLKRLPASGSRVWIAAGLASWASVMLAALACAVELALTGVLPLEQVVPAMLGVHALIGVGEALITCAALALFKQPATVGAVSASRDFAVPALAALLIALCLSPFASPLPDGLEAVMAHYQVLHEAAPLFVTPLADYQVADIASEGLSTALAGLVGVALTFLTAWALALPLTRARAA